MNSSIVLGLWVLNTILDSGGQLAFKAAAMEPGMATGLARWRHMAGRPWLWCGVSCFIGEFIVWLAFLSVIPLAEGVLLGMVSIVVVMLGGRIWFFEHFTRLRLIGISLILVGVAIVGIA
jgi:drug/metabolite transporter (DMT)-like permease